MQLFKELRLNESKTASYCIMVQLNVSLYSLQYRSHHNLKWLSVQWTHSYCMSVPSKRKLIHCYFWNHVIPPEWSYNTSAYIIDTTETWGKCSDSRELCNTHSLAIQQVLLAQALPGALGILEDLLSPSFPQYLAGQEDPTTRRADTCTEDRIFRILCFEGVVWNLLRLNTGHIHNVQRIIHWVGRPLHYDYIMIHCLLIHCLWRWQWMALLDYSLSCLIETLAPSCINLMQCTELSYSQVHPELPWALALPGGPAWESEITGFVFAQVAPDEAVCKTTTVFYGNSLTWGPRDPASPPGPDKPWRMHILLMISGNHQHNVK